MLKTLGVRGRISRSTTDCDGRSALRGTKNIIRSRPSFRDCNQKSFPARQPAGSSPVIRVCPGPLVPPGTTISDHELEWRTRRARAVAYFTAYLGSRETAVFARALASSTLRSKTPLALTRSATHRSVISGAALSPRFLQHPSLIEQPET